MWLCFLYVKSLYYASLTIGCRACSTCWCYALLTSATGKVLAIFLMSYWHKQAWSFLTSSLNAVCFAASLRSPGHSAAAKKQSKKVVSRAHLAVYRFSVVVQQGQPADVERQGAPLPVSTSVWFSPEVGCNTCPVSEPASSAANLQNLSLS